MRYFSFFYKRQLKYEYIYTRYFSQPKNYSLKTFVIFTHNFKMRGFSQL